MDLHILKVTCLLFNQNFIYPVSISTNAYPVISNGVPKIMETSKLTSQSRMTKIAWNIKDVTLLKYHTRFLSASSQYGLT